MLTVNVLGHTHITYRGGLVPLSAKAVALITYLALEQHPQHRERLADLLWHTAEARKNLRVELARIRSAGLDIFPRSRQMLYLEHVTSDLELWRSRLNSGMDQAELSTWLAMLRGLPLSGMEDLGTSALQEWVDQQRSALEELIEQTLVQAHQRFERDGKHWATRIILARAAALGYHLDPASAAGLPDGAAAPAPLAPAWPARPAAPEPVGERRPVTAAETELIGVLARAGRTPQLVVIHGPLGSGKNHLVDHVLERETWRVLRARSTRMSRLVLASLAQELLRFVDAADAVSLRELLLHPGTLEEDAVKLATVLSRLSGPVALVLDHVQNAPVELASLLEFILQAPAAGPRAALLLSRTPPQRTPVCRSLLRRLDPGQAHQIEMLPLTLEQVEEIVRWRGVRDADVHTQAIELLQRSEGNLLHLLSLLDQPPQVSPAGRLPARVRESYSGEFDGWPERLRDALGCLSVVNGDFDLALVQAALGAVEPADAQDVIREGLERGAIVEREADLPLPYPALQPLGAAQADHPSYGFRSEGLRVSLAGALPHEQRQAVRRRLVQALAPAQPGLALYYAERLGPDGDSETLRRSYRNSLPADSPLLAPPSAPAGARRTATAAPAPLALAAAAPQTWQGYMLSRGGGGWFSIVSQGRSGHPQTLKLHFAPPPQTAASRQPPAPVILRLVWRLDVFHGGADLGPRQAPFALRLRLLGSDEAHVFAPEAPRSYREDGLRHLLHPQPVSGEWFEHVLELRPSAGPELLEVAVRGLDVALTLGSLSWNGTELLGQGAGSQVGRREISLGSA